MGTGHRSSRLAPVLPWPGGCRSNAPGLPHLLGAGAGLGAVEMMALFRNVKAANLQSLDSFQNI